jgi:hypothetical protein
MSSDKPEWSTEAPSEAGWYWFDRADGFKTRPEATYVFNDGRHKGVKFKLLWDHTARFASQLPPGRWLKIEEPTP